MTLPKPDELFSQVEKLANETYGPDKYAVRAVSKLIQSNARIEKSVENFEKSTNKAEEIVKSYTRIGLFIGAGQLLLAFILGVIALTLQQS